MRFTCAGPNFDVCVVLREAGVKRDMCKKHGKHCEKLVCRHVLTGLVHFDVSSCFFIAPKTGQLSNLVPRYANTNPRRPNIEPRKAQRSSKIAPRWIPILTKIWSPFGPTVATKIPQKGRGLLGQALPKYQSMFYVSRPDIVLCTPAWLEKSSLFKTVLVFIFAFVLLRVIFFHFFLRIANIELPQSFSKMKYTNLQFTANWKENVNWHEHEIETKNAWNKYEKYIRLTCTPKTSKINVCSLHWSVSRKHYDSNTGAKTACKVLPLIMAQMQLIFGVNDRRDP